MNQSMWVLKREPAEEEIVDQAKDGGVQPDAEGEGDDCEGGKTWRLEELSQGEAKISQHSGNIV
jgi:hypothetical protein